MDDEAMKRRLIDDAAERLLSKIPEVVAIYTHVCFCGAHVDNCYDINAHWEHFGGWKKHLMDYSTGEHE